MDRILAAHLLLMRWKRYSVSWIEFFPASSMWRWSYQKHYRHQIFHINWNHYSRRQSMSFRSSNWIQRLRLQSRNKVTRFIRSPRKSLSKQPILNFTGTCLINLHTIKWRALKIVWISTRRWGIVSARRSHIRWWKELTLHYRWLARSATKKTLWWTFDIVAYS